MNKKNTIAYFSAEIGISASLPTYSGGLGVLAGDHLKSAADIGLPIIGITLLYKEGYFKQRIDELGNQSETYPRFDPKPKLRLLSNKLVIPLRGEKVAMEVYEYQYSGLEGNKISIYFLDTDIEENLEEDRSISLRLYSGNKDHRILQEAILGFGGVQLLEDLGYNDIKTYHMNEGHCSFLTLALLEKYNGNEEKVRSLCHFTTHTPVPAGHDQFSIDRCRKLLGDLLPQKLNLLSWNSVNRLHMTELGLFYSRSANGVSKLHGSVARDQFPKNTIDYITNGIYHPYWLGDSFKNLFDDKISGWQTNPKLLLNLQNISNDDLFLAHQAQKHALIEYVNSQTQKAFSENVLTIGFARRAAEYKRAKLVFSDVERLKKIGTNKIQIIFSGKAHPNDKKGQEIIKDVVSYANKLRGYVKVVFLENYNIWLGRLITSGVDVWLNTPLRPNEASGTSGMKAALNGIPNFSTIDGWWAEGCRHDVNGWAIGLPDKCNDLDDSESLYESLEKLVIPTFYNDKSRWCTIMRESIFTSVSYTAQRMIEEYVNKFYNVE